MDPRRPLAVRRARALLGALALSTAAAAQDAPRVQLQDRTIRAGSVEYAAEVGRLAVPENRAAERSREIQLAFVRLRSSAGEPGPPLFVLPGGPGNSATSLATSPVWQHFLELGDVVLLDPRAVGRSEPDLAWKSEALRPELLFLDRETALEHAREVCGAAAEELGARGVDLAGYTPIQMAHDVDDLRRALGYERVHLLGHSFGTLLGLAILRQHPGSVARLVAVGVAGTGEVMKLPSELDESLRELAAAVAADPRVAEGMPDMRATLERVLADIAAEPLVVPLADPVTGATREVRLGAFGLQLLLVADLGDTSDVPVFPRLLHTLERRDPSVVRWFLQKRLETFSALPVMMLAVRGSCGATEERWERIRREAPASPFGLARCMFSPEAERALGALDAGDAFRAPVVSDVPTLLVSGTLDAHTPPFQAERARAGLSVSGHVVVVNGGHEDLLSDPEVQARILDFLAGAAPEDARVERSPLRFAPLEGDPAGFDHPALRGAR